MSLRVEKRVKSEDNLVSKYDKYWCLGFIIEQNGGFEHGRSGDKPVELYGTVACCIDRRATFIR